MTSAVANILHQVERLTFDERADLTDWLVENLTQHIPADVEQAQLAEVKRRISQIQAGEVKLVSGDEVFAQVRQMVAEAGSVEK